MGSNNLRQRVGEILAAEERQPPDWPEVNRLTDALVGELAANPDTDYSPIVGNFLDDTDIRAKDWDYAEAQRSQVRHYVETGEYRERTPFPGWGCAVVVAAILGALIWLLS